MKRCLYLFLLLALVVSLCSGGALAAALSFVPGEQDIPSRAVFASVTLANGQLLVYEETQQQLLQIDLNDGIVGRQKLWADAGTDVWHGAIMSRGEKLWAIEVSYDSSSGRPCYSGAQLALWTLKDGGIEHVKLADVDLSGFIEDQGFQEGLSEIFDFVQCGDEAFLLIRRESSDLREIYRLGADGRLRRLEIDAPYRIAGAQDGNILYTRPSQQGDVQLCLYSAAQSEVRELFALQGRGSCPYYSAEDNALYYMDDAVYRIDAQASGQSELVGGRPFSDCTGLLCADGRAVIYAKQQISIAPFIDPGQSRSLTIQGSLEDSLYSGYAAQNPNVIVQRSGAPSGHELISAMLQQSDAADIYVLQPNDNLSYTYLRDKGFCAPLADPDAAAAVAAFGEELRAEFCNPQGQACGLPLYVDGSVVLGVNQPLWQSLGFGALPTDWDELLDFLENDWAAYSRSNSDVRLMSYASAAETKQAIFYAMKNDYDLYREQLADVQGYSTDSFRRLANRLLQIDFNAFQYSDEEIPALLSDWYMMAPSMIRPEFDYMTYLPLSIDGTTVNPIRVYLGIAFINPYSKNQDLAQELMGYFARNLDGEVRIVLEPDYCTAIKSDVYDEIVETSEASIAGLKRQLEAAGADQRAQIEQQLAEAEESYVSNLARAGYRVTAEGAQTYKALIAQNGLRIAYEDVGDPNSPDQLQELTNQLLNNIISVDQYTAALDQELVQQELEDQ